MASYGCLCGPDVPSTTWPMSSFRDEFVVPDMRVRLRSLWWVIEELILDEPWWRHALEATAVCVCSVSPLGHSRDVAGHRQKCPATSFTLGPVAGSGGWSPAVDRGVVVRCALPYSRSTSSYTCPSGAVKWT